jgi:hypothetical protein
MAQATRTSALSGLAMPVANQRVIAGQKAARDLQLQQAIQQAKPAQATPQLAQQLGTAQAQMAGQQAVKTAQQGAQQLAQASQLGQQAQAQAAQASLGEQRLGLGAQQLASEKQLADQEEQLKNQMLAERQQFEEGELGRKFANQRQLADFAVLQAKSAEELANYKQTATQAAERNNQINETLYNKLVQQMQADNQVIAQLQDQLATKQMSQRERETSQKILQDKLNKQYQMQIAEGLLANKIQAQQARAAADAAMWNGVGTVVGAGVGAVFGGPAGAAAGASLGGGVGTLAGSQMK